jgi:hypothetical protein
VHHSCSCARRPKEIMQICGTAVNLIGFEKVLSESASWGLTAAFTGIADISNYSEVEGKQNGELGLGTAGYVGSGD